MGVVVNFLWHRVKKYYIRQFRQFCVLLFTFLLGLFIDLWVHEQNEYKLQRAHFFDAVVLIQNGSQSLYPYRKSVWCVCVCVCVVIFFNRSDSCFFQ